MMKEVIVLFILVFAVADVFSQPPAKPPFDTEWVYEKPYNFERAKKLEWEWEFEKAVWYYINLVPENIKEAAKRIKGIKNHIGKPDIFINTTFKMFVVYDPEVNSIENGELVTHKDVFDKKRAWADQLIKAVGN